MVRQWRDELLAECFRVIDAGGGEINIKFSPRSGNKLSPIIKTYPDNQKICEEIETEEE